MPDYPQTPESIQRAQIAQVVERALFRMETGYDVDAQGRIQHDVSTATQRRTAC